MRYGFMNHPAQPLEDQLRLAAEQEFDFIDLTIESPCAARESLNAPRLARMLEDLGLGVVGHTAWYLPIDLPFPGIRKAVAEELVQSLDFFREVGADKVTVHFLPRLPEHIFPPETTAALMVDTLAPAAAHAAATDMRLMIENGPMTHRRIAILRHIYGALPSLFFHLDAGHAYLNSNGAMFHQMLKRFRKRLIHVHVSDNFMKDDLHLPLFAGALPWRHIFKSLLRIGYDDTITLEVFSRDREYLLASRRKVRRLVEKLRETE
ncbi:sugar phosphate isomerase/epimerase [bacterium]|nr:sugar phosphate isomerase/epimerase [candidate division CSSED10-310 bacterium]